MSIHDGAASAELTPGTGGSGSTGSMANVWLPMRDGVYLAATVYIPHASRGPQPCIIEALPYRKDDATSFSHQSEYERLRDEYGYAVARIDLRGTGNSGGRAVDEYPVSEQLDLADAMDWLVAQPWCDGNIGMYGTSYSGFNSLQMACERPPHLKAIVAIYATDDRHTDDVHYMGGLLKWIDLVDYPHYMTAYNVLPPTPAVFGPAWREEWRARFEKNEPWFLTWRENPRDSAYWRQGSVRPAYDRINIPTMIVAGWADGYRNNSFRMMQQLAQNNVPRRLLAGPWAHADTSTSAPGPRIDLVPEMVTWWDRWLRGIDNGIDRAPEAVWYARASHDPAPALDYVPGVWRADSWPSARSSWVEFPLDGPRAYRVIPDVGTAAWISCAGHLPWGQPTDQRYDDAASITWDIDPQGLEIAGNAYVRIAVSSSAPVATIAVRLEDVGPDGTSTLVTRGTLNLTRRNGMDQAEALVPGEVYDVQVELEATTWAWSPERRLRLAMAGTDWPNTVAPPEPLTLTIQSATLLLPKYDPAGSPTPPAFTPGNEHSSESADGVTWRIERDVLAGTTACVTAQGSEYETPYGSMIEAYSGRVTVDTNTHTQTATADVKLSLTFHDDGSGQPTTVHSHAHLEMFSTQTTYEVAITSSCAEGDVVIGQRTWTRSFPRDLA